MSIPGRSVVALLAVAGVVAIALVSVAAAGSSKGQVPACGHPCGLAVSVSKKGTGSGTVTSVPAGIQCGTRCFHKFDGLSSVTLTASPAASSTFKGWSGSCTATSACCVGTSTCKVPANSTGAVVTATFSVIPHCVVPKVKGETLAAAKRSIKSRNCSVGGIRHVASQTVKSGHVISQKPKTGARLKVRAKINLVVSKGSS